MENHVMHLAYTDKDGAERWVCFQCERQVNIVWQPNFKKEVVEEGDQTVSHSGGKGGLTITASISIT